MLLFVLYNTSVTLYDYLVHSMQGTNYWYIRMLPGYKVNYLLLQD